MTKLNYELLFNGQPYNEGLIGFTVNTAINKVPKARLEFNFRQFIPDECDDKNYTLSPAASFEEENTKKQIVYHPGTEVEISVGWGEEKSTVFKGLITRHHLSVNNNGSQVLTLECKHIANLMTLSCKTRMLHQDAGVGSNGEQVSKVADDEVITNLLENSGTNLSLNVQDKAAFAFDHENMLQYNCSDWDFMVMRAEATARVCLVAGDEITLLHPKLDKPVDFEILAGKNLLQYEAELDESLIHPEVSLHSWEIDEQELQESSERATNLDPKGATVRADAHLNYAGDLSVNEAKSLVEHTIGRKALARVRSTAKLKGTTKVLVGKTIDLSAFARGWNGHAFVAGIKHVVRNGSWYTHVQCGLTDQKHSEIYQIKASSAQPLMPSVEGLHYGKVIDYKKSEGGHELLEVELPTANENEQNQTLYARLSTFLAGANGGAVFRPYPGDEVVIGFIGNDPRFPVVLGALYNSQDAVPLDLSGNEQQQTGLCLNDWKLIIDEEAKTMQIASPKGQQFLIDDQNKTIGMMYDDQNAITLSEQGIEMKGAKITLQGTQGIEMEGAKISGKADTEMTLEGGLTLSLEGKVSAKLKGQITQIN